MFAGKKTGDRRLGTFPYPLPFPTRHPSPSRCQDDADDRSQQLRPIYAGIRANPDHIRQQGNRDSDCPKGE